MFSLRYRRPPSTSSISSSITSYDGQEHHHQQQPHIRPPHHNTMDNQSPFYYDEEYDAKTKKPNNTRQNYFTMIFTNEYMGVVIIMFFSLLFRLWSIDFPSLVISTELEICNQINWYMSKKFFIGAYPPLAGLFYTAFAWYFGYSGDEQIYYAGQVPSTFPLQELRIVSAIMGAFLVPIVYLTVRRLGHGRSTATTAAGLLIFENGLITQSKFLMPEGLLCLFCSLAALSWAAQIQRQEKEPFIIPYVFQATTGLFLGFALSVKWQGIIPLAAVWISTVTYVWKILGERHFNFKYIIKQCSIRFMTTAILPTFIYFMLFQFHLDLIPNAGDHDLAVSPPLRYSLEGNEFSPSQQDVAYGSSIALRHLGTNGGYLHSHLKRYESGSTQQEVSTYPYEDMNNIWVIHKASERWNATHPVEYVKNNDRVVLEHYSTLRKLHSHDHKPPSNNKKEQFEVSAYGDPTIADPNDFWWVQILFDDDETDGDDETPIKAIDTRIRLLHSRLCHLLSHNVRMPNEEKPQQEVVCMHAASKGLSTWSIEHAYHEELEEEETTSYKKMTRLEIMKEVHQHMLNYQSVIYDQLAPTPPADPKYQLQLLRARKIKPMNWFFGTATYRLWDQVSGRSVYIAMNPAAKIMTFISLSIVVMYVALNMLLRKRQVKWPRSLSFELAGQKWADYDPVATRELYCQSITFFSTASLIQALALYLMPSFNLKLTDSLPSAYFSAGLIAVVLDAVTLRMGKKAQSYACLLVLLLSFYGFSQLYPVSYGNYFWSQNDCKNVKGINFDCNRYPVQQVINTKNNDSGVEDEGQEEEEKDKERRIATVYVDMPGKAELYRYHIGHEMQADHHISAIQYASFSKAYQEATGVERYHRIQSTPGPSESEVAGWQKEIFSQAKKRAKQKQKQIKAEKKRKEKEAQKEAQAQKGEEEIDNKPEEKEAEEQAQKEEQEVVDNKMEEKEQEQIINQDIEDEQQQQEENKEA